MRAFFRVYILRVTYIRRLHLHLVDRNLSCMFDFLNDITKVVCTILRIDILESARLFHAGNSVHAYAKPGDPGATRRIA